MAKSKKDLLSGAFSTKKTMPDADKIDEITNKVYEKEPEAKKEKIATTKKAETAKAEPMQKTTLDFPKSLHIKLKMQAASKGLTIRKYIIALIKKDMGIEE